MCSQVVGEIGTTESVLITHKGSYDRGVVKTVVRRIEGYCTAKKYSMICYNVHENDLEAALVVTPGKQSPTVTHLNIKGWYAVQALI